MIPRPPYMIISNGLGTAVVVDRATEGQVGWVLRAEKGWQGFVHGQYPPVARTRFRRTAVAKVWEAHVRQEAI